MSAERSPGSRQRSAVRRAAAMLLLAATLAGCRAAPRSRAPGSPFAAADSLRITRRFAEAGPRYRALRDSLADTPDSASLWKAQLYLGDAMLRGSLGDSARVALAAASRLAAGHPDRAGRTYYEWSLYYDRQGKFDSALVEVMRARAIAVATQDTVLEGDTYNAAGRIHSLTGRYHDALADNLRAIALERAIGADTSRGVAVELNELGIDYRHLGRFTDAERMLTEALALERRRANVEGVARVSSNLANVYLATGDLARALPLMRNALAGAHAAGIRRGEVYVSNDLADLYERVGNLTEARRHLEHALALNANGFLAYGRVQSLDELARIELAEGRPTGAAAVLDTALALADADGFGRERVAARATLSRVAVRRGDAAAALRWSDAAVRIADSLGDPDAKAEALEAQGAAREAAGRRSALDSYDSTMALLESWRGRLALGDLRLGVAEPRLAAYEGAIRLLVRDGRAGDAFDVAERARARLLLDLMADRDAGQPASRREALRERLRERYGALQDAPPRDRAAIEREVDAVGDTLSALERADAAEDPGAGTRYPAPASLGVLQRTLLSPGRALLAFFWGDRDVYGWWITRDSVRVARLGAADSLAALVDFLRQTIEGPTARAGPSWTLPAQRAFARFIAPLAPAPMRATDLLAVTDGPLAYVPLEVLIPAPGAPPLGATTRITYGPSASVLLALARRPEAPHPRTVLAVGDPEPVALERGWAWLAPLPYAAAEARDVAALFPHGADVLVKRDATLARWLALHPERYRYLHFAAHTRVSDRRPARTAILLGGRALGLDAIRRLDLDADLVTLSACETALGPRVRGEGVIGLPHAFLAAGARGVVVTLWRVGDEAAARFMQDFYSELRSGRSPAEALLEVRRAWLAQGGAAAQPADWAAFVLVGAGGEEPGASSE